ncbi:helix-turn-helix domain-containing protein [Streptomyces sp. NPDC004732]|uniref:helix-turn-helix domain-containing protein n=1 Tax=Streptomyces sp. NPDC004732 TaxID=3154290 RepID=UPI0033B2F1AC
MSAQDDGGGSGDGDGIGDGIDEVAEFAALLTALKERTDRSYGSLARRLGMNTSTLHRYCAGDAVPLDFAPVERFAALCGATPEQRLELHRRWLLAVAARRRPRAGEARATEAVQAAAVEGSTEPDPDPDPDPAPKTDGDPAGPADLADPAAESDPAPEPPGAPSPPPPPPPPHRPWSRRRHLTVGLASACAVLATLGAFSLLPDGRQTSAARPDRVADQAQTEAGAPQRRGTSPTPSGTPTPKHPSDSATPKKKPDTSRPPGATSTPPRDGKPDGLPLTWSADSQAWQLGCDHDYVIAKPPSQVPPPPAPQDAAPWAATQGAVHGGETLVRLSVQGRSDTAVVLEALRVRVVGRAAPVKGTNYAMDRGCGGAVTPRSFAVDLDKDRPIARAVPGSDTGTPIPAVHMPYRVSAKDPEVLLISAETSACDCRWYLELDWSSQGRTGSVRIDDDGRPFRTSSIKGLPHYAYDPLGRRWGTYG